MAVEIEAPSTDPIVDLKKYSRRQYTRIFASGVSIFGTALAVGKDTLYISEGAPLPYRIGATIASAVGAASIIAIEIFNRKADKKWKIHSDIVHERDKLQNERIWQDRITQLKGPLHR